MSMYICSLSLSACWCPEEAAEVSSLSWLCRFLASPPRLVVSALCFSYLGPYLSLCPSSLVFPHLRHHPWTPCQHPPAHPLPAFGSQPSGTWTAKPDATSSAPRQVSGVRVKPQQDWNHPVRCSFGTAKINNFFIEFHWCLFQNRDEPMHFLLRCYCPDPAKTNKSHWYSMKNHEDLASSRFRPNVVSVSMTFSRLVDIIDSWLNHLPQVIIGRVL